MVVNENLREFKVYDICLSPVTRSAGKSEASIAASSDSFASHQQQCQGNIPSSIVKKIGGREFRIGLAVIDTKNNLYLSRRSRLGNLIKKLLKGSISVVHAHRQAGKSTFAIQELIPACEEAQFEASKGQGRDNIGSAAWYIDLALEEEKKWNTKIDDVLNAKCSHPFLIVIDEAQIIVHREQAKQLVGRMRSFCQSSSISMVAVGTYPTIALFSGVNVWAKGGYSPIATEQVYGLPPFTSDESYQLFDLIQQEHDIEVCTDVRNDMYRVCNGNVGFLTIVAQHFISQQSRCGKIITQSVYYKEWNCFLRDKLLSSRESILSPGELSHDLLSALRFQSSLTRSGIILIPPHTQTILHQYIHAYIHT
jgi:hypothetical protein